MALRWLVLLSDLLRAVQEYSLIRLYFNRHGARPWSIDEGHGTPERTFAGVSVGHVVGVSVYDPAMRGSEEHPCAWIEFYSCRVWELCGSLAEILPDSVTVPVPVMVDLKHLRPIS